MALPHRRTACFLTALTLAAPIVTACGESGAAAESDAATGAPGGKSTAPPDLSGKADGTPAVAEQGRFETPHAPGESVVRQGALTDRALAWRLRGFGNTRLRLTLTARDAGAGPDPYLAVDGPLPDATGAVVGYADDVSPSDRTAQLEVTLPAAGAYRVQAGTYGLFHQQATTPGDVALTVECLENCVPHEWTLAEVFADVAAQQGPAQLQAMVSQGIGALFPDPDTAAAIRAQAEAALNAPTLPEAFPMVPLAAIGTAQALLERPGEPAPAPAAVTFDLQALLTENCTPKRSSLAPLHPSLPDLQTGSAPDYTFDDCTLQRAQDFADVLNNLALENGSAVVNGPTRYESVEDAFTALLDAGHHIVVQNNRYFADFLGLSYRGDPIKAPVWVDTGIADSAGETLKLPAPHTHHTIIVSGPVVNATLMYYMGVSGGVSFRAVESARPRWTGERTRFAYDSDTDRDTIVQLMVTAADLRRKWTQAGAALPALGYGQLGVCNDSTAVLEYTAEGAVTIFPLAHPASDAEQAGGDAIDRALAALPADLAGFEASDALRRIRETLSFEDPADLPFPGLTAQLARLP
jgi:hypothetical protein